MQYPTQIDSALTPRLDIVNFLCIIQITKNKTNTLHLQKIGTL